MKSEKNSIKIMSRIVLPLMLFFLICFFLSSCNQNQIDYDEQIEHCVSYLNEAGGVDGKETKLLSDSRFVAGNSLSDWIAIMLARGYVEEDYEVYLNKLKKYVEQEYLTSDKLDRVKATEWHHISLAVLACGGDPTHFGKTGGGDAINLIADGTYMWVQTDNIAFQGNNALIFALITLDAGRYEIPSDCRYSREALISELLKSQNEEGGFGLVAGSGSDVDMTAMALQALAPYYTNEGQSCKEYYLRDGSDISIKSAVDKALDFLSEQQTSGGFYESGGTYSSESCAQVIIALCSLGIDPENDTRFQKTDRSVVDALMEFKTKDKGFAHNLDENTGQGEDNVMSSQQAGSAFIALKIFRENNGRFYDFSR